MPDFITEISLCLNNAGNNSDKTVLNITGHTTYGSFSLIMVYVGGTAV